MRKTPWALALVWVVLLAGCSAPNPAAHSASNAPNASSTTTSAPSAHLAAQHVNETVAWDGDLGTTECANNGNTDFCVLDGVGAPTSPSTISNRFYARTVGHSFTQAALTLTWQATTPLTTSIRANVEIYSGCPAQCVIRTDFANVTGSSPMAITLGSGALHTGENLGIFFRADARAGVLGAGVAAGQTIHLQGSITYLT
jgi:hypothetical protein